MPLLISDTNIFLDFDAAGMLAELFSLPHEIAVPDLLFEEELRDFHQDLVGLGLRQIELEPEAINRLLELARKYTLPSRVDLSALVAAEQEGCTLVTGDRHLREAAEEEGIPGHGSLWLAEQMIGAGVLDVRRLEVAYQQMQKRGRRLPWAETKRHQPGFEENSELAAIQKKGEPVGPTTIRPRPGPLVAVEAGLHLLRRARTRQQAARLPKARRLSPEDRHDVYPVQQRTSGSLPHWRRRSTQSILAQRVTRSVVYDLQACSGSRKSLKTKDRIPEYGKLPLDGPDPAPALGAIGEPTVERRQNRA